jgi:hypothetical protein
VVFGLRKFIAHGHPDNVLGQGCERKEVDNWGCDALFCVQRRLCLYIHEAIETYSLALEVFEEILEGCF